MEREGLKINIFQDFLFNYFASNQKEWDVYAKSISLEFLKEYNKNFDFMLGKLKELNKRNSNELTLKELRIGEIISNIITLREMIKVNRQVVDVEIDFKAIDEMFIRVEDENDLEEINKTIMAVDDKKSKKQSSVSKKIPSKSFQRLNFYYVYLISFVKDEQSRKDFYRDYLEDKNIITNIDANLVSSWFISAV